MMVHDVTSNGVPIASESTVADIASDVATIATSTPTLGPAAASASAPVTGANTQDANNTNLGTIAGSTTWTGTWTDATGYSQIVTSFLSDQAGTFTIYFSSDGITTDRTIGPYTLAANTDSPQPLEPVRRYYRVAFANSSGSTANVRIETRLSAIPGLLKTRLNDDPTALSPADLTRSVLFGIHDNDATYDTIGINEEHGLHVDLISPLSAFGEVMTSSLQPFVQIDAVYGLVSTDTESLVDSSPGTGTATAASSMFAVTTGTGVGGYGVIRSRRFVRYRPGQGLRYRGTALFTAGVAQSLQFAGLFSATEAVCFGYSGTSFGVLRRVAGATAIHRLTITVGAGGAEDMTITLNGVPFVVASGGALSTTATAERIAEVGAFTGWTSIVSPTSNGSTVTFIQASPAAAAGAFTLTSTGTAAGTFATIQAGAANDDATGFVAQASWNVDTMLGTGGQSNPSGITLDPTKLNVYEIAVAYLGAGSLRYRAMSSTTGRFVTVHEVRYPNSAIITNMRNPSLRPGWIAASLGSTTNLTVKGGSAAAFVEGDTRSTLRDPFGTAINNFTAGTTEYVALSIRNGGTFGGTNNQREIRPASITIGTETNARVIRIRVILNPTMTGTVDWSYVSSARSAVEQATPTAITPTSGSDVAFSIAATGAPTTLDLEKLDLRMEPGDVLAIALTTASGSAVCSVSINWQEV